MSRKKPKKSKIDKICARDMKRSGTKKQVKAEYARQREGFFDMNLGTKTFVDGKHKQPKHKRNPLDEDFSCAGC